MRVSFGAFAAMALLGLATAGHADAAQGPFGVHMGMQKQELEKVVALRQDPEEGSRFTSSSAPTPNGAFDAYQYLISSESGLCQVSAMTKRAQPEVTGRTFQQLYDLLEQRYGKPSRGAAGEVAIWHNQALPHRLQSVGVQTVGADSHKGSFVHIVYSFQNLSGCTPRATVEATGL